MPNRWPGSPRSYPTVAEIMRSVSSVQSYSNFDAFSSQQVMIAKILCMYNFTALYFTEQLTGKHDLEVFIRSYIRLTAPGSNLRRSSDLGWKTKSKWTNFRNIFLFPIILLASVTLFRVQFVYRLKWHKWHDTNFTLYYYWFGEAFFLLWDLFVDV